MGLGCVGSSKRECHRMCCNAMYRDHPFDVYSARHKIPQSWDGEHYQYDSRGSFHGAGDSAG